MADISGSGLMAALAAEKGVASPEYRAAEQAYIESRASKDLGDFIGTKIIAPVLGLFGGPGGALVTTSLVNQQVAKTDAETQEIFHTAVQRRTAENLAARSAGNVGGGRMSLFDDEMGFDFGNGGGFDFSGLGDTLGGYANTALQLYGQYQGFEGGDASSEGSEVVTQGGPIMAEGPTVVAQAGVGSGVMWLGGYLARAFGSSAASAVYRGASGVAVKMRELWPLVRKYGSGPVAAGLGIGGAGLATLLMQPAALHGRHGKRGRGRGISAAQVRTTTRTLKQIKKLYRLMPTRPSSGRSYYTHRHYRGRR